MYYTVENNQEMNFPLDIYFFNMVGNMSYNERKGDVLMFWGLQK